MEVETQNRRRNSMFKKLKSWASLTLSPKAEVNNKQKPGNVFESNISSKDKTEGSKYIGEMCVGRYVDVQLKDHLMYWGVGQIISINEGELFLHVLGWDKTDDLTILQDDPRIAPFRLHSYTNKETPSQHHKIILDKNIILEHINLIKKYSDEGGLYKSSAIEFTQDIRGKLFFFICWVFTEDISPKTPSTMDTSLDPVSPSEEILTLLVDFMIELMRLVISWLRELPKLPAFHSECTKNPNLHLLDVKAALICSLPEIIYFLRLIFGQFSSSSTIIKLINEILSPEDTEAEYIDTPIENSWIITKMIEEFMEMNGLRGILEVLQYNTESPNYPLSMITSLLEPFLAAIKSHPILLNIYARNIVVNITFRLETATPEALDGCIGAKNVPNYKFWKCLEDIERTYNPNCKEKIQRMQFEFAFKLLRCYNNPQNLVEGVTQLIRYIHIAKETRNIDRDYIIQKLIEEKTLEILFTLDDNIIRLSNEIILFLASNDSLCILDIDNIWLYYNKQKNPLGLQIIAQMSKYLLFDVLEHIWLQIREIEESEYDQLHLNFLKDYILAVAGNKHQPKWTEEAYRSHIYNLSIFWNILDESTPNTDSVKNLAQNYIVDVLLLPQHSDLQSKYRKLALINIQNQNSFVRSAIYFMMSYKQDTEYFYHILNKSFSKAMKLNCIGYLLIPNIFKSLLNYHSLVRRNILDPSPKAKGIISDRQFTENIRYEQAMKFYLEFIEFLAIISDLIIIYRSELEQLWNIYMIKYNIKDERDYFWVAFTKEYPIPSMRNEKHFAILSNDVAEEFFLEILCDPLKLNFEDLSILSWLCFRAYFLWINELYLKIIHIEESIKILDMDLLGAKEFQVIMFKSKNNDVKIQAKVLGRQIGFTVENIV